MDLLIKWSGLIIALISLIVALISFIKSSKTQKLQSKINELELIIKEYEVEKINLNKEEENVACIEARVIKTSNKNYHIKVWNSGETRAYNVNMKTEENVMVIPFLDKLPFEFLDPKKSFKIQIIIIPNTKRKFLITTIWYDNSGKEFQNEQMADI